MRLCGLVLLIYGTWAVYKFVEPQMSVRFGASQIASFSPEGSCTAGTLYLRSLRGLQYAVRLGNVTGRTRILRYDAAARRWVDA